MKANKILIVFFCLITTLTAEGFENNPTKSALKGMPPQGMAHSRFVPSKPQGPFRLSYRVVETDSQFHVTIYGSTGQLLASDVGIEFKKIDGESFLAVGQNDLNVSRKAAPVQTQRGSFQATYVFPEENARSDRIVATVTASFGGQMSSKSLAIQLGKPAEAEKARTCKDQHCYSESIIRLGE